MGFVTTGLRKAYYSDDGEDALTGGARGPAQDEVRLRPVGGGRDQG